MDHFNYSWNSEYNYYEHSNLNYGETNNMYDMHESFDISFAPTYNPNFSWSLTRSPIGHEFHMHNQSHAQSDLSYPIEQETSPSLEDTLQQFMQSTYQILLAQSHSISKIETIVGQLATVIESEKQVYLNQPIPNPNSQIQSEKENEVVEELVISIQPPNETK